MSEKELKTLNRLLRSIKQLHRKISKAEEELFTVKSDLADFLALIDQPVTSASSSDGIGEYANRRRRREEEARKEYARLGARELELTPLPGGHFEALIDGKRVKLPQRLGALLELLARDDGATTDGLVRWKSQDELTHLLARRPGQQISDSSLKTLICRLRRELRTKADLHRDFIQMDPKQGYRFALRTNRGGPK